MFLKMLFDMMAASFIVSFFNVFVGFITIAAIGWAIYTVYMDAVSRKKQNEIKVQELKIKVIEQNNKLNEKRIKLLNEIKELVALPINNQFPGGFSLRWITKPTIFFAAQQSSLIQNPPSNNTLYQTIYQELRFNVIIKVISLFPDAIEEYNDFLYNASKNLNPQYSCSQQTIDSYNKFIEKCYSIMLIRTK